MKQRFNWSNQYDWILFHSKLGHYLCKSKRKSSNKEQELFISQPLIHDLKIEQLIQKEFYESNKSRSKLVWIEFDCQPLTREHQFIQKTKLLRVNILKMRQLILIFPFYLKLNLFMVFNSFWTFQFFYFSFQIFILLKVIWIFAILQIFSVFLAVKIL